MTTKSRYYGASRTADEFIMGGIIYRGTILTIRDRDTGEELAEVSREARDAILAALQEQESLAAARLQVATDLSDTIAAIADHFKEHDAGTLDKATLIESIRQLLVNAGLKELV